MLRSGLVFSSLWLGSADPTCSEHTNHHGATIGQENQLLQIQKVHKHKSRGAANIHHAADVRAFRRNLKQAPADCSGDSSWNAGYGNCDTYAPGAMNAGFCDYDVSGGLVAKDVCSQCGYCAGGQAAHAPADCSGDSSWDAGYGNCDTYAPGAMNAGYCDYDQSGGLVAKDVCSQCGDCVGGGASAGGQGAQQPNGEQLPSGETYCQQGPRAYSQALCGDSSCCSWWEGDGGYCYSAIGSEPCDGAGDFGDGGEQEFQGAMIPADRAFICPGVIPGQPSVSCSDMELPNGDDDILMYVLAPGNYEGAPLMVFQIGSVFPSQQPEPLLTDISWNAVSTEVLHFNGVVTEGNSSQTVGILVKGSSIPAGPSSGTWNNTHQPNEEEAVDWIIDNLITDMAEGFAMYQSLGGQLPQAMPGQSLLSWLNKKASVMQPKEDFFAAAAEKGAQAPTPTPTPTPTPIEAVELTRKVKVADSRRRAPSL